jgi:transposase-like protein
MSKRESRSYDKEFKVNAVRLYLEKGCSYKELSRELGIPDTTLRGWVDNYKKEGEGAFPGKGYIKPSEAEMARLHKELQIVREERDILKKALGIFSLRQK